MSHPPQFTIEQGVEFCRKAEAILRPLGHHVALTGSVLYGLGTGKDLDVMVYPHQPETARPPSELIRALEPLGIFPKHPRYLEPEYEGKHLHIVELDGKRVDLFFMAALPNFTRR